MDAAVRTETTSLLEAFERAGSDSWQRLVPIVYEELRQMAHRQLTREAGRGSLQTTALVHEAYLRLVDDSRVTTKGKAYFFAAASRAMRQVLVDEARRRGRQKRGGGQAHVSLSDALAAEDRLDEFAGDLVELDDALDELAALNPRHARVVECRFFAGMSVEETAQALEVSERTVKYDWTLARAWLFRRLRDEGPTPGVP
jgi:RNA polymerase sigma-70 factor (ECF subfamily)